MPKILIEVTYPIDLKHYPEHIQNETQAMVFDCKQSETGAGDIGLLLENDLEIVGVQDDNGELHKL